MEKSYKKKTEAGKKSKKSASMIDEVDAELLELLNGLTIDSGPLPELSAEDLDFWVPVTDGPFFTPGPIEVVETVEENKKPPTKEEAMKHIEGHWLYENDDHRSFLFSATRRGDIPQRVQMVPEPKLLRKRLYRTGNDTSINFWNALHDAFVKEQEFQVTNCWIVVEK